ncbi:4402_t:CDS:1, partial [Racocetra fulgida]
FTRGKRYTGGGVVGVEFETDAFASIINVSTNISSCSKNNAAASLSVMPE